MDVLAFLFGFAIFLFLFAALGHVLWLMGAAVFRVFRPSVDATKRQVTPTAESDLWESAEALQRMLYGRLIDAERIDRCEIVSKKLLVVIRFPCRSR